MFTDEQYLRLYVSSSEPWEALLKQLYTKRLTKKEVQKRIAYTIVNAQLGKVSENKGDMWLAVGDTFASYNTEDWSSRFQAIKDADKVIVSIRKQLKTIPYLPTDSISTDARTVWVWKYLQSFWGLTAEQAAEEVCLYGAASIERYVKEWRKTPIRKGRYHFTHALHNFAAINNIDLVVWKQSEAKRLYDLTYQHDKTQKHNTISAG
jgi:hypothetical protein